MTDAPATHTTDQTRSVLKDIKELIEADDESEYDVYSTLHAADDGTVKVKLDDDSTGLTYWLVLQPTDD